MVNIIGSGLGYLSSNHEQGCLHFTYHYGKESNESSKRKTLNINQL